MTSEVKQLRARIVLGWGTAWEVLRVLSAFLSFCLVAAACGIVASVGAGTQPQRQCNAQTNEQRETNTQLQAYRRITDINLTAMGFEPMQIALVELESTPLDHSGKLSDCDAAPGIIVAVNVCIKREPVISSSMCAKNISKRRNNLPTTAATPVSTDKLAVS